jgi:hypothetical protein
MKIPEMLCMTKASLIRIRLSRIILGFILGALLVYVFLPPKIIIERVEVDPYTKKEHVLIDKTSQVHKVSKVLVAEVLNSAKHKADVEFPRTSDVLAIVAIESSFKLDAKSSVGAKGLMQVLYKKTQYDIESNITDGVALLKQYKQQLGSEAAAVQAYNVGIGNYLKGMRNTQYLAKFTREQTNFKRMLA